MEETTKMLFGFMGVLSLLALVYIDRKFPDETPIDNWVYWIIGGYIVFVFAGPRGVRKALETITNKIGDKFIGSSKKKNE